MLHALNRAERRRLQAKRKARDARLQMEFFEEEVETAKADLPSDLKYEWDKQTQQFEVVTEDE